jgi:2'-5' RNA ligase
MRLFVGIPLASEVLNELSEAVARLRSAQDGLRWTTPESWHITLQFLGNTDQQHCECVLARLGEIHAAQFQVTLGEFGFFDRAGVFFVDVVPSADLVALSRRVTEATAKCGFAAETRPYHPHITLARAKGENKERQLRALQERMGFGIPGSRIRTRGTRDKAAQGWGTRKSVEERAGFSEFAAGEFLLYESHTRPEGAEYEVRGRFKLGPDR